MKVKTLQTVVLIMLFLTIVTVRSYAQTEEWRETYDFSIGAPPNLYPAKDVGRKIGFDAAGNIYVLVSTSQWLDRTSDSPTEWVIFKYDLDGNKQWHSSVGNGNWSSSPSSFYVDQQGNVYGAYTSYYFSSGDDHNANIFKLNSDGTLAWIKSWNNETANEDDWAIALNVDSGGNVYFVIKSNFSTGIYASYYPVIQKFDANGTLLWEVIGEGGSPTDVAMDNSGNLFVLLGGEVRKYNSGDGTLIGSGDIEYFWDDNGLPTNPTYWRPAACTAIEMASDGSFYVTGTASQRNWYWVGPGGEDWEWDNHDNIFTAKLDNDCNVTWRDEYGTYGDDELPAELVIADDGNILVTGSTPYNLVTLKYSPDGTRTGTYLYSDPCAVFYIDGIYAYTIESSSSGLSQYLLSTGAEQWNLPVTGLKSCCFLIGHNNGNIYLTGSVPDGEAHQPVTSSYADDMVIIKFDTEFAPPLPATPTNFVPLSNYNGAVPLAWGPPDDMTGFLGYDVHRYTMQGAYTELASMIQKQYFRDETVDNGTSYLYSVSARYASGESEMVATVQATPQEDGYTLQCGPASAIPTLDGHIQSTEWDPAGTIDITYPGVSEEVTLYAMGDENFLYIAVNDPGDNTLDDYDGIGIIFDEDLDREWPATDNGQEGIIQIYWNSGSVESRFQPFYGTWPDGINGGSWSTPDGVTHQMSISSGHVQLEARLDLSTCPFNGSGGDVLGVFFYSLEGNEGFHGAWPQETADHLTSLTSGNAWAHGAFSFGDIILSQYSDVNEDVARVPKSYRLKQNYPNPFNPVTTIEFSLTQSDMISLKIYDLLGKELEILFNEFCHTGEYKVEWNAEDFPSGIYLCRLEAGDFVETRKLILQK